MAQSIPTLALLGAIHPHANFAQHHLPLPHPHTPPAIAGGIFSNHSLEDPEVYDDDVILHASDQDLEPYYRPLNSLDDTIAMSGNCANAGSGFGKNEMYPCFDSHVTYGLAVTGLDVNGTTFPVSLSTDGAVSEPDTRMGAPPSSLKGTVTVRGLTPGTKYILYRYLGTETLPTGPNNFNVGFQYATPFTASAESWTLKDPKPFASNTAIYYVCVKA